jgi:hypothetical protein
MNLTIDYTFELIRYIFSIAIFIQSIEYIYIRNTFKDNGIWRINDIKSDFAFLPDFIQNILLHILKYQTFINIIYLRLLLSIVLFFTPNVLIIIVLFFISLLIALRWRGTFNGGSDYMGLIILISLLIANISKNPNYKLASIYYLCFQVSSSYFLAGFVKIKNKDWRNGTSLKKFISNTIYTNNKKIVTFTCNNNVNMILSIVIILWELSFPLAFLDSKFAIFILCFGFIFHLINAYILGLNRFLIIWVATYPAILFLSQR